MAVPSKRPFGFGFYRIPCSCGKGTWDRLAAPFWQNICGILDLVNQTSLGLAENFEKCEFLVFASTKIVSKIEGFWTRVIFEAITIRMEPNMVNREMGVNLSICWSPALQLIESQ